MRAVLVPDAPATVGELHVEASAHVALRVGRLAAAKRLCVRRDEALTALDPTETSGQVPALYCPLYSLQNLREGCK